MHNEFFFGINQMTGVFLSDAHDSPNSTDWKCESMHAVSMQRTGNRYTNKTPNTLDCFAQTEEGNCIAQVRHHA